MVRHLLALTLAVTGAVAQRTYDPKIGCAITTDLVWKNARNSASASSYCITLLKIPVATKWKTSTPAKVTSQFSIVDTSTADTSTVKESTTEYSTHWNTETEYSTSTSWTTTSTTVTEGGAQCIERASPATITAELVSVDPPVEDERPLQQAPEFKDRGEGPFSLKVKRAAVPAANPDPMITPAPVADAQVIGRDTAGSANFARKMARELDMQNVGMEKRKAVPSPDHPVPALNHWKHAALNTACSCMAIVKPRVTSTTTLKAETVFTTSTSTTTPLTTSTSTSTDWTTSTSTTTLLDAEHTATSTRTEHYTLATPSANGLNWFKWTNTYDHGSSDPNVDPSLYQQYNYEQSGSGLQDSNVASNNWPNSNQGKLPGSDTDIDFQHLSMTMQGYFFAKDAGDYTFTSGIGVDNELFFYTGQIALGATKWTKENADYDAIRIGGSTIVGTKTLNLAAGEIVPVSIVWVNGGAPGQALLKVTTPDGTVHDSTAGFFASPCQDSDFVNPSQGD